MKKYLLAASTAVSVAALTSIANAADIAPVPTVYDWSGVYFGLNAGAAWNNSELDGGGRCDDLDTDSIVTCDDVFDEISDAFDNRVDDSGAAFTGGAMIGANWQWETFVMGVEADINYAGLGASQGRDLDDLNDFYLVDEFYARSKAELDMDWWGTLRGRVGFAADNFLFYGTGGLAWGKVEASARFDADWFDGGLLIDDTDDVYGSASFGDSTSETAFGWTIGVGGEWALDAWTFGLEYLYVDLGSADLNYRGDIADLDLDVDELDISGGADVDYQFSVVRATAKWKF